MGEPGPADAAPTKPETFPGRLWPLSFIIFLTTFLTTSVELGLVQPLWSQTCDQSHHCHDFLIVVWALATALSIISLLYMITLLGLHRFGRLRSYWNTAGFLSFFIMLLWFCLLLVGWIKPADTRIGAYSDVLYLDPRRKIRIKGPGDTGGPGTFPWSVDFYNVVAGGNYSTRELLQPYLNVASGGYASVIMCNIAL